MRQCAVKIIAILFLSLLSSTALAWNANAHRLVVLIACDWLDSNTKAYYQKYNQALDKSYASTSLVAAASWLDEIRSYDKTFSHYHYINQPYSQDGTAILPVSKTNAVTAIHEAMFVLTSSRRNNSEKGFALRVLLHVVADLHQPLHAINRFSYQYPRGDLGGVRVTLEKNKVAKNLHGYWDKGGGVFNLRKSGKRLFLEAKRIEQLYFCKIEDSNPEQWAKESYQIAKKIAYDSFDGKITPRYQKQVRAISQKQVALAACRLANLLNYLIKKTP